jgi:hypothetical protein
LAITLSGSTSLKLDQHDQPHIAYCDDARNTINYAVIATPQFFLPVTQKYHAQSAAMALAGMVW